MVTPLLTARRVDHDAKRRAKGPSHDVLLRKACGKEECLINMSSKQGITNTGESVLETIPLGGLGEFGMNMMLVVWDDTGILIDAGSMFPGPELLGVDLVVPDVSCIAERVGRLRAVVLTHGHEDHIGALPYVWPLLDGPVYGTPLTLALVAPKLTEHGFDPSGRLQEVSAGDIVAVGTLKIEFIRVTHSMPDCVAVAIHTPVGVIIHTGDFKFDETPVDGQPSDTHRLAELGELGVLALFGDSTNIDQPGVSGSERDVAPGLEEVFERSNGRILVTTFSSSLYRIQLVANMAEQFGRKLVLVGRGIVENTKIGERLGHLRFPVGLRIKDRETNRYSPRDVVYVATGSQGEPTAALSRIATGEHRHLALEPGDVVVFSARAIPGNGKAIGRLMDHIARGGAKCVQGGRRPVHVSGHASEDELKLMLSLVRPRYFVPIHGEYRFLADHARVATELAGDRTEVLLVENGQVVRFSPGPGRIVGSVKVGRTLLDGTRSAEVVEEVLRERQHLAREGVVVPVVTVNRQRAGVVGTPEVITRGMVLDEQVDALLETLPELMRDIVAQEDHDEFPGQDQVAEQVRGELQRVIRKRLGRRPVVLPVIMES